MAKKDTTPMMKQYYEIKEQYPDAFLFYRVGDFYELFEDDAIKGAQILELTLTHRSNNILYFFYTITFKHSIINNSFYKVNTSNKHS